MNFDKCIYQGNHHHNQGRECFLPLKKVPACYFEIYCQPQATTHLLYVSFI